MEGLKNEGAGGGKKKHSELLRYTLVVLMPRIWNLWEIIAAYTCRYNTWMSNLRPNERQQLLKT